jgi:hypothetical protein
MDDGVCSVLGGGGVIVTVTSVAHKLQHYFQITAREHEDSAPSTMVGVFPCDDRGFDNK